MLGCKPGATILSTNKVADACQRKQVADWRTVQVISGSSASSLMLTLEALQWTALICGWYPAFLPAEPVR